MSVPRKNEAGATSHLFLQFNMEQQARVTTLEDQLLLHLCTLWPSMPKLLPSQVPHSATPFALCFADL
jgi:hypothetical protein